MRIARIDGKKVIHTSLWARLLYQSHYSRLAGHPGEKRMYNRVWKEHYRLHIENAVYKTVRDCGECALNKPVDKHRRPPQLFPASGL